MVCKPICRLVAAAVLSLAIGSLSLGAPQDAAAAQKEAGVIVLRHVSPSHVMYSLGLVSIEDYVAGKVPTWYRSSASSTASQPSTSMPCSFRKF